MICLILDIFIYNYTKYKSYFFLVSLYNKNIINITQHDYLGYFYSWDDVRKYLNKHHPESYINKVFSISINNEYHYYLIISSCVIEEVTLPSNAGELKS